MTMNKLKYKNAILYFTKYWNSKYQNLSYTKLSSLLYYLDFINYRDRKETVTGDFYIKKYYGATPENLLSVLYEMRNSREIKIINLHSISSQPIYFISKKYPDEKVFTKKEIKLLKNICKEFLDWSTDKIVEQIYLEAPYFYSKVFDKIDFNYSKDIKFFKGGYKMLED